jgi:translation initiation factor 2D
MPSTTFYTTHLLPSRPAYNPSSIPIDIKHSTHKSLTAFLKAAEKANLVSLKSIKTELFVTGVSTKHPEVAGHRPYLTMREAEAKKACKEGREEEERGKVNEMRVVEKWKPHLSSVKFFQEIGREFVLFCGIFITPARMLIFFLTMAKISTTALYALPEIKALVSAYVAENNLVNPHGQQYVNLDALLVSALHSSGGKPNRSEAPPEFLKREELARKLADKMQAWHEIQPEDKETVIRCDHHLRDSLMSL